MKIIFTFIILFFSFIPFTYAGKISKKNSMYTGFAILDKEEMFLAGEWYLVMKHCNNKFTQPWLEKLASISWEDYRNFKKGYGKYSQNYKVTSCNKQTGKEVAEWYESITDYLAQEVKLKTGYSESDSNNSVSEVDESDNIEEQLKKLKSLYEEDLITQDEYDEKRQAILDKM